MLNFRKLKQDYSSNVLKEGKFLNDKKLVLSAKIIKLDSQAIRLNCKVLGNFENTYTCEVEINRHESCVTDSDCDCPYKYDCQHLAAVLYYLESHFDAIVVAYSKEADLEKTEEIDEDDKATLRETFKEAESKEVQRKNKKQQKELLQEYIGASQALGQSSFFLPEETLHQDKAEFALIFAPPSQPIDSNTPLEIQIALRLPFRSKPLIVPNIKEFIDAIRYNESIYISNKRYFFALGSFDSESEAILKMVMDYLRYPEPKGNERNTRVAQIDFETFGSILAQAQDLALTRSKQEDLIDDNGEAYLKMPCIYCSTLEEPLRYTNQAALLRFELEYLKAPAPKILLKPSIVLSHDQVTALEGVSLFECSKPGLLSHHTYYRFQPNIKRKHLKNLSVIRNTTIPEPLFGTFVENSLPELMRYAEVANRDIIEKFVTLPFVGKVGAECHINYLNGELEASLEFVYDNITVPAAPTQLNVNHMFPFVTEEGILARNLTEEQKIIDDLFQDFIFEPSQGFYVSKNEKKIVEFMTEVIPNNQDSVKFHCPENLLDQFIYDETHFELHLKESNRVDVYIVDLKVHGHLSGTTIDLLWDCISSKKPFIELVRKKPGRKKGASDASSKTHKILVLDLEKLAPIVQIFDELGINNLDDHKEERPLWSLASLDESQFEDLPIDFSMSKKLKEIQAQILGAQTVEANAIPKEIKASLRGYQTEGVGWLERLRNMHLSGVLADDMGLGKTLQAIIAVTQFINKNPKTISIVVCPTSLVYNWKEEFYKFNSKLRVLAVDGTPVQRKKLLTDIHRFDVVITSYSLLQKDIDFYQTIQFGYSILDEAQHIKNRGTRNAKSVKMIKALHRLILTGTPIENSLEELWSLFDYLMPGLLSSYDRFIEKYIRNPSSTITKNLENLKRKVSPFILRRMKKDVLSELPPISEIVYHCHLSETQRKLYKSYADSAREELSQLVKKEGFDRVQIHVLATLTRLKQICCHPAIFAKEKPENGDSAKYEMLIELLNTLIEGNHKTVIFSQYTRMLQIIRQDLQQQGIRFEYLDGSSKDRLGIVKQFNEDQRIPVFLVSLKAGGVGLNLVGADTVIHYDMWWNPAVENQATDRVHRLGQKQSVSSYKLVTLDTIEEKILDLQNRKKGLVKEIISTDDEAISKLTWEEVLELLQT